MCPRPQEGSVLAVACFDGALKFFQLSGQQKSKDRELAFDPLSLAFFAHGEYMAVAGTDKAASLYTKDGVCLTQVGAWFSSACHCRCIGSYVHANPVHHAWRLPWRFCIPRRWVLQGMQKRSMSLLALFFAVMHEVASLYTKEGVCLAWWVQRHSPSHCLFPSLSCSRWPAFTSAACPCIQTFPMGLDGPSSSVHQLLSASFDLWQIIQRDHWVWCARPRPNANAVAVGCDNGSVVMCSLTFATVHGLYADRYAYREQMTDVVVQHLITDDKVRGHCFAGVAMFLSERTATTATRSAAADCTCAVPRHRQKRPFCSFWRCHICLRSNTDSGMRALLRPQVRIRCRDYVKKIAIYKNRVAVQLPSKVVIYELEEGGGEYDMNYKSKYKIQQKMECNLLVVTSHHLILCQVGGAWTAMGWRNFLFHGCFVVASARQAIIARRGPAAAIPMAS